MDTPRTDSPQTRPGRRGLLSAAVGGALTALDGLPAFSASAAPVRPVGSPMLPEGQGGTTELWWQAPADDRSMITQGLPVGNGRLGALVGNDPGRERLFLTDATLWTGDLNRPWTRTASSPTPARTSGRSPCWAS
ncbi:glycoside hydrolase N-terminal domain-containing protein [Streptomyces europaeiscabiei]|uniref:glycoside hydrolase N-terminal domain-containing protein n=1 Tax=Streptomyces europaeiscabiei TaxID=146819 RepID=UPI0038D4F436